MALLAPHSSDPAIKDVGYRVMNMSSTPLLQHLVQRRIRAAMAGCLHKCDHSGSGGQRVLPPPHGHSPRVALRAVDGHPQPRLASNGGHHPQGLVTSLQDRPLCDKNEQRGVQAWQRRGVVTQASRTVLTVTLLNRWLF